jgi:transposase
VKPLPESVSLSAEQVEALIDHVNASNLAASERTVLVQLVRSHVWVMWALQEGKLSLKRLRQLLFAPPAETTAATSVESTEEAAAPGQPSSSPPPSDVEAPSPPREPRRRGGHLAGQGHLGADAYGGAERVECRHETLSVGQHCPVCGQGTLYGLPPGVEIRLGGQALLSAIRYEVERLRCSACGQVFRAPLPAEAGVDKYRPSARAALVVGRYLLGLPGYRLEAYQAMVGVPVPDATQWDQIEHVADCAYKVFAHLETIAAQGELIYQDDTSVRILSLLKENRQMVAAAEARGLVKPSERTGMHTTALVVKVGDHTIVLYYSGRPHAGENLQALLKQREAQRPPPLVMSDALSSNEAPGVALIRCHCLAHGRRKFSDLEALFPQECQVVLHVMREVFDHDEYARAKHRTPEARLAHHQAYSQLLMEGLKRWLHQQFDTRLVEPNSSLGKAIAYWLNHWASLTRFLSVVGAPLDANVVERALKLFIRQRNNSLFYKTEHSASIASVLTSLIATCLHAGVNAMHYLVALQEHRSEVFADPAAWLPWTYRAAALSS